MLRFRLPLPLWLSLAFTAAISFVSTAAQWPQLRCWLVHITGCWHGFKRPVTSMITCYISWRSFCNDMTPLCSLAGFRTWSIWEGPAFWQASNPEYLDHNSAFIWNQVFKSPQLYFWTQAVPKLNREIVILQLWQRVAVWITMYYRVENFIQIFVRTIATVGYAVSCCLVSYRTHVGRQ